MGTTQVGAYSDSAGHSFIRETVAKYISKRDQTPLVPGNNIHEIGMERRVKHTLISLELINYFNFHKKNNWNAHCRKSYLNWKNTKKSI